MKLHRLLILCLAAFIAGALLAPNGGRGAFAHRIRELEKASQSAPSASRARSAKAFGEKVSSLSRLFSALQETSPLKRSSDLYDATEDLTAAEIPDLLGVGKNLPYDSRIALKKALLERWFDLDPAASEAWLRGNLRDFDAWTTWAALFPERALEEVHAHPGALRSRNMLIRSLNALAGGYDLKFYAAKLATLPPDSTRDGYMREVVNDWARQDPAATFAFARSLPAGQLRADATAAALNSLVKRDPIHALRFATDLLPERRNDRDGKGFLAGLAREAAKKDRQAALQWVAQLPEDQRSGPFREVASQWARTDPMAALDWSAANGVDPGSLIRDAMAGSPDQTLRWIQSTPDGPERDRMLESALAADSPFVSTNSDHQAVLASLDQLSPEAQLRVAKQLGSINGTDASMARSQSWIAALPDGPLRLAAIESAGAFYGGQNPDAALQKLSFSDPASQDAALQGMVRGAATYNSEAAANFALKMTDPDTQRTSFDSFIPDWLYNDPKQAEAWLQKNSSLPQDWIAEWRVESQWGR